MQQETLSHFCSSLIKPQAMYLRASRSSSKKSSSKKRNNDMESQEHFEIIEERISPMKDPNNKIRIKLS